jgi:two-component system, response regulator PdtaR
MLQTMGYDVCAIETTEANAVTAAVRCAPDLVIVDLWLGVERGVAAVDKMLRTGSVPHLLSAAILRGPRHF